LMNRPKAIGTHAESLATIWLREHGFPDAVRIAQAGAADTGDIRLMPGLHAEVKGGRAAEHASVGQVEQWLYECDAEAMHSGAKVFLIMKRRGHGAAGVGNWTTAARMGEFGSLSDPKGTMYLMLPLFRFVELPVMRAFALQAGVQ